LTELWRIALCEVQREKLAADGLLRIGIPSYRPLILKRHTTRSGRVYQREKCMFPGYLFVKFSTQMEGWTRLFVTPGIRLSKPLMMEGDRYAVIPEDKIEAISVHERRGFGERNALAKSMDLHVGDEVKIKAGRWGELLGKIETLDDDERISVLIKFLGAEKRVIVPVTRLAV
jgi:transcription antitermination factor NusG